MRMLEWLSDLTVFRVTGLIGVTLGLLGVILPGIVYRGKDGERYSFLNHFISELGERGISRWAWIFNSGMIISGFCVIFAAISLGLGLTGFLAKLGIIFGVVTGIGLMMVGIFPMDNIKPHTKAAIIFFRGGLLMVLFYSLAILFPSQNEALISRFYGLIGLIPVAAFASFLGLMWNMGDKVDQPLSTEDVKRPRVWKFAISEWMVYFSVIVWIFVLSLAIG